MKHLLIIIMLLSAAATNAQQSFLLGGFGGRIIYKNSQAKPSDEKPTFLALNSGARSYFRGNTFKIYNGVGLFSGTYKLENSTIKFATDTVQFDDKQVGIKKGTYPYGDLEDEMKEDLLFLNGTYTFSQKSNRFILEQKKGDVRVKYRFNLPKRFHGFWPESKR